jgi:hypothetical protein
MRRRSLLLALVLTALAVLGTVLSTPLASATATCDVRLGSAHYATLQAAVSAASPGDKLKVRGTCYGDTTVGKNLTIAGQSNPGFGPATLNGANNAQRLGSVVTVDQGGTVVITGLTITGGTGSAVGACSGGVHGGGVLNQGSLTLAHSTVSGNAAQNGGGVENLDGSLVVTNSTVSGNAGVGIENSQSRTPCGGLGGSLTLTNSAVRENSASGIVNYGSLTLTGSTVSDNRDGGIGNGGPTTLTNSTVSGNAGVGIDSSGYILPGGVTLTNSTIAQNSGSGIASNHEVLTLNHTNVTGNTGSQECSDTCFTAGGGITSAQDQEVTLANSTVAGNTAERGGGLWVSYETVTLTNSTVARNAARYGGGIAGTFGEAAPAVVLDGSSSVSGNTASVDGGGVWNPPVEGPSATRLILNDSASVSRNAASGNGGGIYNGDGEVILNDSASVTRNRASVRGGGIYNTRSATLSFGTGWTGTVSVNKPDDVFKAQ